MKHFLNLKAPGISIFWGTLLLLALSATGANAQSETDSTNTVIDTPRIEKDPRPYRKNLLKINLAALTMVKSYNFSYEHLLGRKVSFVAGYNKMSEKTLSDLPITDKVSDKIFDDGDRVKDDLDRIRVSNTAYTAEFRFYGGQFSGARGFYLALYGRYVNTKINYDYEYETNSATYNIPLKSDLKGYAGGILLGTQFIISRTIALDIYVGGHYGTIKGDADGPVDLSSMSQQDKMNLKDDLEGTTTIRDKNYVNAAVTNSGVTAKVKGPLIGLRGGFSLGIAF
ncbi:DUF3575 domain-containing protein [Pedobacter nyackensis]|uniref:DUF3575 domain-containing protein n=1 Tax=Pedobacter nyackensis TaxID=475255 RepID=A0A1W1ZYL4_9SPHI|nr:DUF3575 domain-containing protein [Pedobacter nyackensis]SMC53490.1 hypothetical protein SAMN04488101_101163 [Pedobacter nyackensis]